MEHERYDWISRRAHDIWEAEGCPSGRDREHWSQAVAEWEEAGSSVTEPPAGIVRSVLVVDDEPLIRFATVEALEQAGFEVYEAASADEAMSILKSNEFDVVFTDVNMPGSIDGLGLMSRIRSRSPKTRIIVTSGHVNLGAFDLPSGVSFIPKPYSYDVIIGMLKRRGALS